MSRLSRRSAHSDIGARSGIHAILSHRFNFAALLALISVYLLFLLSNGTFRLFAPELFSRAYGSMLMHMLHGEFTVDPEAIGYEAFPRDGKVYSYFGIFSSLLRLVALPFADVRQVELARLSCLSGVVIFVALQLRMLLIVYDSLPAPARVPELLASWLRQPFSADRRSTSLPRHGFITSRSSGQRRWPPGSTSS